MRVIHIVAWMDPGHGGVYQFVSCLAERQRALHMSVAVACLRGGTPPDLPPTQTITGTVKGPAIFGYSPELGRRLRECLPGVGVLHNHGLWTYPNYLASRCARRSNLPLVLSVHGMLQPWALRHHLLRKAPVWWSWQKRALERADVLHATSQLEADRLRATGFQTPVAVIPLGVDMPPEPLAVKAQPSEHVVLVLARIHPIKGLSNLLTAWRAIDSTGWRLLIAGPDPNGYRAVLERAAADARLDNVCFTGPVCGTAKWDLIAGSDLLVLPSYTENFGLVVLEALACGVPVIATSAAPWSLLASEGCGWWVEVGAAPLAEALTAAMRLSDAERTAMGSRGKSVVRSRFNWDTIARDMNSVYEWLLGRGPRPVCIQD